MIVIPPVADDVARADQAESGGRAAAQVLDGAGRQQLVRSQTLDNVAIKLMSD